jgi:LAT3 family solute carrier family 43 protein 3
MRSNHPFQVISNLQASEFAIEAAFDSAGIVFGYSGLVKVFVYDVKAFAEFCDGQPLPCHAQTERLTLMYTIAATTISGCAIFVGMFLDHFGPRITACVGSVIFALGKVSISLNLCMPLACLKGFMS